VAFTVVKGNLSDLSKSITQSIVCNFKMQESEEKSPTDHIATPNHAPAKQTIENEVFGSQPELNNDLKYNH